MCRLKNLRKIVIPLWRSGRRVEATSSPGWHSRRRASRPNFCSGHLYVGSSNSHVPHTPQNQTPSLLLPPENLLSPQSLPPSRGAVLSSSRRLRSGQQPWSHTEAPFPLQPTSEPPAGHTSATSSRLLAPLAPHSKPASPRLPQSSSGHSPWSSLALHSLESIPSSVAKWPYQTQTG